MISTIQYATDSTWLTVPPLEEINTGLEALQKALEATQSEHARLKAIVFGEIERLSIRDQKHYSYSNLGRIFDLESPAAIQANNLKNRLLESFPACVGSTATATDFIRTRGVNKVCQKYPIKQWATLTKRLLAWVAKAQKIKG